MQCKCGAASMKCHRSARGTVEHPRHTPASTAARSAAAMLLCKRLHMVQISRHSASCMPVLMPRSCRYGTAHKFLQPFAQLRRLALHDLSSCYSDDLLLGLICAGLPSSSSAQPGAAACSSNVLFRQIRDVAFEHSSRTPLHPRPLQHLKLVSCRLLRPPQGVSCWMLFIWSPAHSLLAGSAQKRWPAAPLMHHMLLTGHLQARLFVALHGMARLC